MLPTLLPALYGGHTNITLRPGELAGAVALALAIVVMVRGGFLLNSFSGEARGIGTITVAIGGLAVTAYIVGLMFLHY